METSVGAGEALVAGIGDWAPCALRKGDPAASVERLVPGGEDEQAAHGGELGKKACVGLQDLRAAAGCVGVQGAAL